MRTLIKTATLAATLMLSVSMLVAPAAVEKAQAADASDVSAHRHHRHERYRPSYPHPLYYGRPVYYAPKPFLPIPPLWGYGWEWW